MRWPRTQGLRLLLTAVLTAALAGCGSGGTDGDAPEGPAAAGDAAGEITVLAASSLSEVFEDLAAAFEDANPGARVRLSFAASPTLVAQVQEGAPADVVATADDVTMDKLVESGDVAEPRDFARNELAIAVAPGNPEGIGGIGDLARSGLVVVLCDMTVPCGRLADEAFESAGVSVDAASREQNVKATLAKVELGEADAAVVYATDTHANDAVTEIPIPSGQNVTAALPIATVRDARNASTAERFADFVLSGRGREMLLAAGFLAP